MSQNLKRGISVSWDDDLRSRSVLRIKKQRGKLTLEEIEDALRYGGHGAWQGIYAIFLNCSESTCGGSGWMDEYEQKGDGIDLYQIDEQGECPICSNMVPPFDYCPNCGEYWKNDKSTK